MALCRVCRYVQYFSGVVSLEAAVVGYFEGYGLHARLLLRFVRCTSVNIVHLLTYVRTKGFRG